MKTTVVTLQGQDFIATEPAHQLLMAHLKKLQKATRFHPGAYRDNVEALRDVLMERGGKQVSRASMATVLSLVGLPEKQSLNDTFQAKCPRLSHVTTVIWRPLARCGRFTARHWQQSLIVLAAAITVILSAGYVFSALMTVQSSDAASGWQTMSTSIGPVRYYNDRTDTISSASDWFSGWQADTVYAVLFLVMSMLLLRLRRKGRLPFVLALVGCGFLFLCLYTVQKQLTPDFATGKNVSMQTKPLQPRLAYLRQCGDEIPYVFDGQTSGMLFRSLRDEGFTLVSPIKTVFSNGTIDVGELCAQYDLLRQTHAKSDIVLQEYTKQANGTLRAYDYSDIENDSVTTSFGLFVKS